MSVVTRNSATMSATCSGPRGRRAWPLTDGRSAGSDQRYRPPRPRSWCLRRRHRWSHPRAQPRWSTDHRSRRSPPVRRMWPAPGARSPGRGRSPGDPQAEHVWSAGQGSARSRRRSPSRSCAGPVRALRSNWRVRVVPTTTRVADQTSGHTERSGSHRVTHRSRESSRSVRVQRARTGGSFTAETKGPICQTR